MVSKKIAKLISYNCKSLKRSIDGVRTLCGEADIVALQEHWLLSHEIPLLGTVSDDFSYTGCSAVDTEAGVLVGRPYGGVAILWRKNVFQCASVIRTVSTRIVAVKLGLQDRSILVFSVYMPVNATDNLPIFTKCLSEIHAILDDNSDVEAVYVLGDFNAHPAELFYRELEQFCLEQDWCCVDVDMLGYMSNTYTYISEAHGCHRWLDHCIVTKSARQTVRNITVRQDVYWSDHYPLIVECDLNKVQIKCTTAKSPLEGVFWGERQPAQVDLYHDLCNNGLKQLKFPMECKDCAGRTCTNSNHYKVLDNIYSTIINVLTEGARKSSKNRHRKKHIVGWNKYVSDAHRDAREKFLCWIYAGRPRQGRVHLEMVESRKLFKSKLKWCQEKQEQIKCDILATSHSAKDFKGFWKNTNKLSVKPGVPVSVGGVSDGKSIANAFRELFTVSSLYQPGNKRMSDTKATVGDSTIQFTAKQVEKVIRTMQRGKSPGHDGLSIEHLKYAGQCLPHVLAMFFSLCISHAYLPEQLMKTVVVPLVKNRTGDIADFANYRPISLATVIAKVLDSLLDEHLSTHVRIHDAQFGFRAGLSTESAILCLKRAVRYYKDRNTPVFACFLDLSKAFDLVVYDLLWDKLRKSMVAPEYVSLLKYWYANQINQVRWAGEWSDQYKMECGVRQGGLTSPVLFNLYINGLIEELSSMHVGCHIDGVCVNNISYADDMVLLGPSINSIRKLVQKCESYAAQHGLRYNSSKSEMVLFKARKYNPQNIPEVRLGGVVLKVVRKFKYLGHIVTEDLDDDLDIERERRALAVRGNMLIRRFARCTREVKLTLFKAYCTSFYSCSLWVKHTKRVYNMLRVQFNNIFRMMFKLPSHCSASGMFAEAHTDDFYAIRRKRIASLLRRVRGSGNVILKMVAGRLDCPILGHWVKIVTGRIKQNNLI
ncbi:uncharacterized protein LOC133533986 [Cydia pomonella]|uniref:uncharacterized protein LOC133533986 n=1 Tax=Cydia pomonella TaxID=82600 RepID=UPI002ADDE82C|nr:uncharacterized protein LOC133533986 [Cydia pomonella]